MSITGRSNRRENLSFDEDALTGKISDVIVALQAARDQAPEEYRDAVEIEVEAEPGWEGTADLSAKVFYMRSETDAEHDEHLFREQGEIRYRLSEERRLYERLKSKFEGTN